MKILLVSRFNVPNIGDLAISNILVKRLSVFGEVKKFNLFGSPFEYHNVNSINSGEELKKNKIISFLRRNNFKVIIKIYSYLKNRFVLTEKNSDIYKKNVGEYNVIVIAGGNMMMSLEQSTKTLDLLNDYVSIAKQSSKPILFMNIGIGPFFEERHAKYAVNILNRADYVSFRDRSSYELYLENGGVDNKAEISIDPVFHYPNENKRVVKKVGNSKTIGINIIDNKLIGGKYGNTSYFIEGYANIINKFLDNNYEIELFITSIEDIGALNEVYALFKQVERVKVTEINGLQDLDTLYRRLDLLIGTRMHSMIIAYTYLIPIIGLSWQEKIYSFFNTIESMENVYPFEKMQENQDRIVAKAIGLINNSEENAIKAIYNLSKIRALGEKDTEALKRVLENEY